jgi:hypothetical protein
MDGVISHITCATPEMADTVPLVKDMATFAQAKRPNASFDWQTIGSYAIARSFAYAANKAIDRFGFADLNGPNMKYVAEHDMTGYTGEGLVPPIVWSTTNHDGPHNVTVIKTKPHSGYEILAPFYNMPPWPSQAADPTFWMQ